MIKKTTTTYISTVDLWAYCIYSLQAGGGGMEYHLHQHGPKGTRDTVYPVYTLGCGRTLSFHVFNEGWQGLKFRWLYYSSLLLYSRMTFLFCSLLLWYPQKFKTKSRESEPELNLGSPVHSCPCPIFLHLSLSLSLCLPRGDVEVILSECPLLGTVKHCVVSVLPRSKWVRSSRPRWQDLCGWRILHLDQRASGMHSGERWGFLI